MSTVVYIVSAVLCPIIVFLSRVGQLGGALFIVLGGNLWLELGAALFCGCWAVGEGAQLLQRQALAWMSEKILKELTRKVEQKLDE
jgi:hypothetical protein